MVNVFLVLEFVTKQNEILPDVARELRRLGRYRCRLTRDWRANLKHRLWALGLPTFVISMGPVHLRPERRFAPPWATLWEETDIDKIEELEIMTRAGLPVPRWAALDKDSAPDLSGFGPFVVVKPATGARGAFVRVLKTGRVRWKPREVGFNPLTGNREVSEKLIVQEYVHTGPWPISYRVGTVFGEPVYMYRLVADRARDPFREAPARSEDFSGRTIVAGSKGSTVDEDVPKDVLDLARSVHEAFPAVPSLGIDIVRHHGTGELHVIEVNGNGNAFAVTGNQYQKLLEESGIDLRRQFGAAAAVARGIHERIAREPR